MQYSQDNDEKFPLLSVDNTQSGMFQTGAPWAMTRAQTWCDRIYPYVKSQQIFQCPSVGAAEGGATTDYSAYGANVFLVKYFNGEGWNSTTTANQQYPLASVNRPSEVILLTDFREGNTHKVGAWGHTGANYSVPYAYITMPGDARRGGCVTAGTNCLYDPVDDRHLDGANYAYIDGHVKWSKITNGAGTDGTANSHSMSALYGDTTTSGGDANNWSIDWTAAANAKAKPYWAPSL